jgi:hypothetical protein
MSWVAWKSILNEAKYSTPIQTGPEAHQDSYISGTVPYTGSEWPAYGVNHPYPSTTEVIERVELYLYSPSVPSWQFAE